MTSNRNDTRQPNGFLNSAYTFVVFVFSCGSLFFIGIFYLCINFVRESWLNYLEKRFPNLEFVRKTTLRSAIDTHRNMGIITLLLTVKGHCSPSTIKKRLLEEIVDKKQNDGQYVYRHLRMPLTTRWGWYAWQKFIPFKIDNHLIFASSHYRGRPLSDANIQECVSDTVSKYFVPDSPPWQITIFQLGTAEKFYLLVRFHHMLLSPQGMDLESFLTLRKTENEVTTETPIKESNLFQNCKILRRPHPFQELYKTPKALPKLFERVHESFTNNWNEFLSVYDPVQNPSVTKKPGLKTPVAIFVIVFVSVIKQMIIHPTRSLKIFTSALSQREMSWSLVVRSLWNTLNPLAFVIILCKSLCNIAVLLIKSPLFFACEFRSLYMINDENYIDASYVKAIISLWIGLKDSIKEIFYYTKLLYNGPRVILEEFLLANKYSNHHFQFVPLCGRKVVSWSNAVPLKKIQEIEDVTGASESEILIAATSASLRDFLMQYSLDVPDTVLTMGRYFPEEKIIQSRIKKSSSCGSGVLCLPLPIRNPFGLECDPVIELRAVQQIILEARLKQPALYLASLCELEYGILSKVLPSPILRLIFNFLSRRFSVILSEVAPSELGGFKKHYLWGQEVEDLMYWKPPQANICVSLTLMTFGDHVRLGVIADALLSPHHTFITGTFAQHIWELAAAADVTTNSENYSFVSDESGSSGATSRSSRDSKFSSSSSDLEFDGRNYFDDENNLNQNDFTRKYFQSKHLKFNIP